MSSFVQAATGYESLLRVNDPRVPYRFDRIFQGEGFLARRLAKQRFKLLQRLDAELERMMEEGEKVEHVSWGIEYSFVEAYFMGLWHYLLNRRAVVLTGRRILLLQINSRRRLMDLKCQIRYEAIKGFVRASFGVLGIELRNGQKVYLTSVPRRDRKTLRAAIEARLASPEVQQRAAQASGKQNLCPHCYTTVTGFPGQCPRCVGAFKSGARAGWLSFLLPGLGDLYLGHRSLACVELLGALALWTIMIPALWGVYQESGGTAVGLLAAAVPLALLFLATHGLDAWITRRTGRKGLYPAR